jgi:hypothetical protein
MALLFYINCATGQGICSSFPTHYTLLIPLLVITVALYFCNINFVLVKNYNASKIGIPLFYSTSGIGVGVYSAMVVSIVYPCQNFHPLFLGSIIEATGISVLTWALYQGHTATIFGMMGLIGCGTGMRL